MVQVNEETIPLEEYHDLPSQDDAKSLRCYWYSGRSDIPRSYTENSSKEELVLEHVLEYSRQFKIIYDPTRELLLAPQNECGKRKFICTTIRPTKLPYTELYDYQNCAKFVANYLEYEELAEPDKLPEIIPSPANVLDEWQAGDAFDFAIALCSLLIGTGYDAYVVYGTAPKFITTKDESLLQCPFDTSFADLMEKEDHRYDADEEQMVEKREPEPDPIPGGFAVEQKEPHKSTYDIEMTNRTQEEARKNKLLQETIDDDQPDFEKSDPYGKSRLHAWVLIQKGTRQMSESVFIEPTTGREYFLDKSPYFSVQGIFNHENFWINLDPQMDLDSLYPLEFKEDDDGQWEYVMIQQGKNKEGEEDGEGEDAEAQDEDEEGEFDEEPLDMPPPWSPKLYVNKDKFVDGTPNGEKTVFYKKCKIDMYSECKQVDGLVKRITLYEDYKRLITKEIRSYYANRKDKLVIRRRFPYEFKLIEHYESSLANNHWKKLIQIDGQYRKLYFYHHRQKDGLILRTEIFTEDKNKIIEEYKNRADKLIYRSCSFDPNAEKLSNQLKLKVNNYGEKEIPIKKMTQKFELDTEQPAAQQIKKTEFNMDKSRVYIYYHYEEGRITSSDFDWDRKDLIGHAGVDANANGVDQEESKDQQIKQKIHALEMRCHDHIKEQEKSIGGEIAMRQDGEMAINQQRIQQNPEDIFVRILEKSIYQKARDKMKMGKKKDQDDTAQTAEKDYLAATLKKCGFQDVKELEEEAAMQVKSEYMRSLKERLLNRAEIIQRRLDEEQRNLENAYQKLKRKGDQFSAPDQEAYEKEVNEANFRMDILTERASQHYKNALEMFAKADEMLTKDERLKVLNKQN